MLETGGSTLQEDFEIDEALLQRCRALAES